MTNLPRFVVELHDVHADDGRALDAMLQLLPATCATHAAVLVVPNWRGAATIQRGHAVAERLRALANQRVLHGLTHWLGPRWLDRVWHGTDDEGEFARLDERQAAERVHQALALYEDAFEERPQWFCAPRWTSSDAARDVVSRAGLAQMEREGLRLTNGDYVRAPVVWFDNGTQPITNAMGRVQQRVRFRRALQERSPLRLSIHPRDTVDRTSRRAIESTLGQLLDDGWRCVSLDTMVSPR